MYAHFKFMYILYIFFIWNGCNFIFVGYLFNLNCLVLSNYGILIGCKICDNFNFVFELGKYSGIFDENKM